MPTAEKDIFAVAGWNFVAGDRQIEGILRDLPPGSRLVVRNRLANVLATLAGIRDLGTRGLQVYAPENALVEPVLDLDGRYAPEDFHALALTRWFGVAIADARDAAPARSLVLATGYTVAHEAEAERLAAWLAGQPDLAVVLLVPPGEALAACLRPYAAAAWSTQHHRGLDAFARATVEEAVGEFEPERVYVASPDPDALLYTAVGAADYMLRSHGGTTRDAGRRVHALAFARAEVPAGPPVALRALVKAHMQAVLGVASTDADGRFAASGEAIAIDLV